jgi:hypothetical protein
MQWFLSIHPPSPLVITCYLARILIHSTTQLPNEYDKHFVDYVGGESTVKWGRGKPTTDVEGEVGDVVGLVREKDGGVSVLQRAMNRRAAQVQLRPRARPVQHRRRDVLRRRGSRLLRFVLHARSTSFPQLLLVLDRITAIIGRHLERVEWRHHQLPTNQPPTARSALPAAA